MNKPALIVIAAVCLGGIGFFLFQRMVPPSPQGADDGRSSGARVSPRPSLVGSAGAPRPDPGPTPLPEALAKAQAYYAEHFARLRHLVDVEYPAALAKRKADPHAAVGRKFGQTYPKMLEQAHPIKDATRIASELFDYQTKEQAAKTNPFIYGIGVLGVVKFYGDTLADTTPVDDTTVGAIVREVLQTPEGFQEARGLVADIEGNMLHHDDLAKWASSLESSEDLFAYLQASRAKYQALQDKLAGVSPLTPEQSAVTDRAGQTKTVWNVSKDYEKLHDGGLGAIRQEYGPLQWGLRDLLNHVPEDSPEKRELLTALADVYARVKQMETDDGG